MVNLQKGLVGHWTLDSSDTSGGTAYDSSAYGNHGTINGSVTADISGKVGEAYSFNGSDGYIELTQDIASVNSSHSVSMWISTNDNTSQQFYFSFRPIMVVQANLNWSTNGEMSVYDTSNYNYIGDVPPNNTFTHILWTYNDDSDEWYAYKNGEQVNTWTNSISSGGGSDNPVIGDYKSGGGNIPFDGKIDDVRVYDRALFEQEVSALYNMRSQKKSNISPITDEIVHRSVNEKDITLKRDSFGSWICVQNYEHYGGTNPTVSPGDKFPQFPNGETTVSEIENSGENGELRHVDNISQYGDWNVDAVKLEATTTNHSRKINYYTTNQSVIDSIVNNSTSVGYSELKSSIQKYPDHTAFLPDAAGNTTDKNSNQIFGNGFPMYDSGEYHWATKGLGDRWEVDDYPGGPGKTTIHRVWIRTGLF